MPPSRLPTGCLGSCFLRENRGMYDCHAPPRVPVTKLAFLVVLVCVLSAGRTLAKNDKHDSSNFTYTEPNRLGIILDGGSTGTKLRVFSWPPRNTTKQLPDVTMIYSEKFKPSLDTFSSKINEIPTYILGIVRRAMELIPSKLHKETPIYLFMTAGARFLDGSLSHGVIQKVRSVLSQKSVNPFIFQQSFARVLSGEEEGAYAWLAVNYLQGLLHSYKPDNTVGVLEMGGGSTQISFLPRVPVYANKYSVHLIDRVYGIYSHSYLYYGQYYMEVRINRHLMKTATLLEPVNPCMLRGDVVSFTYANRTMLIRGGGDWQKCETILHYFLQSAPNDMCSPKPCAIGPVYQPSITEKTFYAIAGFAYNAKDLEVIDTGSRINLYMMRGKAISYCNNSVQTIMARTKIPTRFLSSLCMMGLYIPMLLTQAYGFSPFTKNIVVATDINSKEISWSLGAILNEIQYLDILERASTSAADIVTSQIAVYVTVLGILASLLCLRNLH